MPGQSSLPCADRAALQALQPLAFSAGRSRQTKWKSDAESELTFCKCASNTASAPDPPFASQYNRGGVVSKMKSPFVQPVAAPMEAALITVAVALATRPWSAKPVPVTDICKWS